MASLVSVIIPCFNAENTIDRSIGSVYEQDWPLVELIVINDGSTDKSEDRIIRWMQKFEKKEGYTLKYIVQENHGPGGAVKNGLNYVAGKYLTLLDADDRYLPGAISEKAYYLDTHPEYTMVRSNGFIISGENKWLFTYNDLEKTGDAFEMLMRGETYNWAGSYMVRTDIVADYYKNRPFYPSRFGQNLQIMIPAAYRGECGFIDRPLMEYVRDGNSLSKEIDPSKAKEKSIKNAEGYLDIRRHIISSLSISDEEKKKWSLIAEVICQRSLMQIGLEHDDRLLIDGAVYLLKELRAYTVEDRIVYHSKNNKLLSLFWRAVRKTVNASPLRKSDVNIIN